MFTNPELKRNFWLEFSAHRIVATPLVLFGICLLTTLAKYSPEQQAPTCLSLFGLMIFLWGTSLSANSVGREIASRTWYQQRLSALSPLTLGLGKLFGSTSFTWYAGAWCLIAFVSFASQYATLPAIGGVVIYMVLLGIMGHAVSLYASLLYIDRSRRFANTILGWLAIMMAYRSSMTDVTKASIFTPTLEKVTWYGQNIPSNWFVLGTVCLALAWLFMGINALLRRELQFKNSIITWTLFLIFVIIYTGGFIPELNFESSFMQYQDDMLSHNFRLTVILSVMVPLLYGVLLYEKKDLVTYRKLVEHIKSHYWKTIYTLTPRWYITFKFVAVLIIAQLYISYGSDSPAYQTMFYSTIGLFGFIIRDIGLCHFFNLHPNSKRGNSTFLFYLLILYVLVPSIFLAANLKTAASSFFFGVQNEILPLIFIYLQAILAWVMVGMRWNNTQLYYKDIEEKSLMSH